MPIESPDCHLCYWLTGHRLEVAVISSPSLICRSSSQNSEKHLTTRLLAYCKRIELRNSQMKEMHRARYMGRGTELPCPLWENHSPHISMCSPTWKRSEPWPFRFLWGLITQHGWLNHWPLASDSTSSPPPLPRCQKGGTESLVGFPGIQPPSLGALQKSPH